MDVMERRIRRTMPTFRPVNIRSYRMRLGGAEKRRHQTVKWKVELAERPRKSFLRRPEWRAPLSGRSLPAILSPARLLEPQRHIETRDQLLVAPGLAQEI